MSTEHQQYSTENQRKAILQYCKQRGMVVVRTYTDAGKSGLRIDGREALKQLIHDVESGAADFAAILVYDVSRWGRFQDADESAYYEYVCRRAKIDVHYCAEQFENDGSPVSTIVKCVKRAMAGEYSRELSAKTFVGQCRLIELGFRQGSPAGFGLRRVLVDKSGNRKGTLLRGEQKSLQTDRVVLAPGPPDELETVRWMYNVFVEERISESQLAKMLNDRGILTDQGKPWTRGIVHRVLSSEKYVGNNVYNRVSFKLKKRRIVNPPGLWIRSNDAFQPVVAPELFEKAQTIIRDRSKRYSNQELLNSLSDLLTREGKLSRRLIDETDGMACSLVYLNRFGSLANAYKLVGYTSSRDVEYVETDRQLRQMYSGIVANVIERIQSLGGRVSRDSSTKFLNVNDEFTTSIVILRCRQTDSGAYRWLNRVNEGAVPDIMIAIRMGASNQTPLDYYLLPRIDLTRASFLLAEFNSADLDTYRFDNLDFLFGMAKHVKLLEAA